MREQIEEAWNHALGKMDAYLTELRVLKAEGKLKNENSEVLKNLYSRYKIAFATLLTRIEHDSYSVEIRFEAAFRLSEFALLTFGLDSGEKLKNFYESLYRFQEKVEARGLREKDKVLHEIIIAYKEKNPQCCHTALARLNKLSALLIGNKIELKLLVTEEKAKQQIPFKDTLENLRYHLRSCWHLQKLKSLQMQISDELKKQQTELVHFQISYLLKRKRPFIKEALNSIRSLKYKQKPEWEEKLNTLMQQICQDIESLIQLGLIEKAKALYHYYTKETRDFGKIAGDALLILYPRLETPFEVCEENRLIELNEATLIENLLYPAFWKNKLMKLREVVNAQDPDSLKRFNQNIQDFIHNLWEHCETLTAIAYRGHKKEKLRYCLLGLGSISRGAMLPYSDMECALLISKPNHEPLTWEGSSTSLLLSKCTPENIEILKKLIGKKFEKIQTIDPEKSNYKYIPFTEKEILDIISELNKFTEEVKNLKESLISVEGSSTSLLLSKCTPENIEILKKLISKKFEKIQTINPEKSDYKYIPFTEKEILDIISELNKLDTEEVKNLKESFISVDEIEATGHLQTIYELFEFYLTSFGEETAGQEGLCLDGAAQPRLLKLLRGTPEELLNQWKGREIKGEEGLVYSLIHASYLAGERDLFENYQHLLKNMLESPSQHFSQRPWHQNWLIETQFKETKKTYEKEIKPFQLGDCIDIKKPYLKLLTFLVLDIALYHNIHVESFEFNAVLAELERQKRLPFTLKEFAFYFNKIQMIRAQAHLNSGYQTDEVVLDDEIHQLLTKLDKNYLSPFYSSLDELFKSGWARFEQMVWEKSLKAHFSQQPESHAQVTLFLSSGTETAYLSAPFIEQIIDPAGNLKYDSNKGNSAAYFDGSICLKILEPQDAKGIEQQGALTTWLSREYGVMVLSQLLGMLWMPKGCAGQLHYQDKKGNPNTYTIWIGEQVTAFPFGIFEQEFGLYNNNNILNFQNFIELFLLSLLTYPEDGHPGNFLVDMQDDKIRLVPIDNKRSFVKPYDAIQSLFSKSYTLHLKTLLYLLDEMYAPFSENFKNWLLQLEGGRLVQDLEQALRVMDKQLQIEGINPSSLDTELPFNTITFPRLFLYWPLIRIQQIQGILKDNAGHSINCLDLLKSLEPTVFNYYENLRNNYKNSNQFLSAFFYAQFPKEYRQWKPDRALKNQPQNLVIGYSSRTWQTQIRQYGKASVKILLDSGLGLTNWLENICVGRQTKATQEILLALLEIQGPSLKKINLAECEILTDEKLETILKQAAQLKILDISYCKNTTIRSWEIVTFWAPCIQEFYANGNIQWNNTRYRNSQWALDYLRVLDIRGVELKYRFMQTVQSSKSGLRWIRFGSMPKIKNRNILIFINNFLIGEALYTNKEIMNQKTCNEKLRQAAKNGETEVVQWLLFSKGAKLEEKDTNGLTPLFYAVCGSHLETIKYLIEIGKANINVIAANGDTVLSIVLNNSNRKIMNYLSDQGASLDVKAKWGVTFLMQAASNRQIENMKWLIEKGALVDEKSAEKNSRQGRTALFYAVEGKDLETVKCLVEIGKADINATADNGDTALRLAICQGKIDIVDYLYSQGAFLDINSKNKRGVTLLMQAASNGKVEIIEWLIEKGAVVNKKSEEENNRQGRTALFYAVEGKDLKTVECLVEIGKANINAVADNGDAVLSLAICQGNMDIVNYLRDQGTQVNKPTKKEINTMAFSEEILDESDFLVNSLSIDNSVDLSEDSTSLSSEIIIPSITDNIEIKKAILVDSDRTIKIGGEEKTCRIITAKDDGDCGITATYFSLMEQGYAELAGCFNRESFIYLICLINNNPSEFQIYQAYINAIYQAAKTDNGEAWAEKFQSKGYWFEECHFRFLSAYFNIRFEFFVKENHQFIPELSYESIFEGDTDKPIIIVSLAHVSTQTDSLHAPLNHFNALIIGESFTIHKTLENTGHINTLFSKPEPSYSQSFLVEKFGILDANSEDKNVVDAKETSIKIQEELSSEDFNRDRLTEGVQHSLN